VREGVSLGVGTRGGGSLDCGSGVKSLAGVGGAAAVTDGGRGGSGSAGGGGVLVGVDFLVSGATGRSSTRRRLFAGGSGEPARDCGGEGGRVGDSGLGISLSI
jgi:hypothetical protein